MKIPERNTIANKQELNDFRDMYYIMPLSDTCACDIRIYAIHKKENRLINITGYISELWGYGWETRYLKCRYSAYWGDIGKSLSELLERDIIADWLQ